MEMLVEPVQTCDGTLFFPLRYTMNLLWEIASGRASRRMMAVSGRRAALIIFKLSSRGKLGVTLPVFLSVVSLTLASTMMRTSTPLSIAFLSSSATGA